VIEQRQPDAVRSGGAGGWDTVLAEAALDLGVPLLVDLPNRHYRSVYGDGMSDELLARAAEVRFIVDRPTCANWRFRWGAERWWLDNLTRNHAMVADSSEAVAGAHLNPLVLAGVRSDPGQRRLGHKGGTAECLRHIVTKSDLAGVFWVPDVADPAAEWVAIPRQAGLFEPTL
jgi:hypothetical protein